MRLSAVLRSAILGRLRARPSILLFACCGLLAAIGTIDVETGWQLSFSLFYLIPISLGAGMIGRTAGVALAVAGAIVWYVADNLHGLHYTSDAIAYWNGAVRLVFFVLFAWTLSGLRTAMRQLHRMATVDGLTGVLNRRAFYDVASREIERARRYQHPLALGFVDLDNFKRVNDDRGHAEGDQVLTLVAECMRDAVRSLDVVARLGGDEFAVLLPETDGDSAATVFAKIERRLRDVMAEGGWPVSASIGVVAFGAPPETLADALHLADEVMYGAKDAGKDRVVVRQL